MRLPIRTTEEQPPMSQRRHPSHCDRYRPGRALGPTGRPLTRDDLPPPDTKRWVIRRKAEVVAAVRGGLITLEEACRRYQLSVDEFLSWQHRLDEHGLAGLRSTRTKEYRLRPPRRYPGR